MRPIAKVSMVVIALIIAMVIDMVAPWLCLLALMELRRFECSATPTCSC